MARKKGGNPKTQPSEMEDPVVVARLRRALATKGYTPTEIIQLIAVMSRNPYRRENPPCLYLMGRLTLDRC